MSREIKFRAWNSVTKEMEQVTQINLKNHYVQTTFNKIGYSYGQPDDVIVEQYTGQKDKNGKEIYEGDIVQFPVLGKPHREIVSWSDIDSAFIVGMMYLSRFQPKMEVLGNVHTNPELLEAQRRL